MCICWQRFLCVYLFIKLASCFVYFGRVSLWGFSGGPGHIFFLCGAPLCGMSGWYNLFECQPGVGGGAVQVFPSFGLCCGGYGTIEMWEGVVRFFLLSSVCCLFSWQVVVCGRAPFLIIIFLILVLFVGLVFYKLLILF